MSRRTLICGYCGTHNEPSKACTCAQATAARESRRAELDARLIAEKHGVATTDGTNRPRDRV